MNIQWVLADNLILDPMIDLAHMKQGGAFWGSWKTRRAYNTDNVICHELGKAQELIKRAFQHTCNFYIPNSTYLALNRPLGVRVYEGDFMGNDVANRDEIVAMNLAASISDVVLLLGFDFSETPSLPDNLEDVKAKHYRGLVHQAIKSRPTVQWILVDHENEIRSELSSLPNFGRDTFNNVLAILNN